MVHFWAGRRERHSDTDKSIGSHGDVSLSLAAFIFASSLVFVFVAVLSLSLSLGRIRRPNRLLRCCCRLLTDRVVVADPAWLTMPLPAPSAARTTRYCVQCRIDLFLFPSVDLKKRSDSKLRSARHTHTHGMAFFFFFFFLFFLLRHHHHPLFPFPPSSSLLFISDPPPWLPTKLGRVFFRFFLSPLRKPTNAEKKCRE